jgi:hypothetical protein
MSFQENHRVVLPFRMGHENPGEGTKQAHRETHSASEYDFSQEEAASFFCTE